MVDVNGAAHASSFPTSSDRRFKNVVGEVDSVLDKLAHLKAYQFTWKRGYQAYGQFPDNNQNPVPQLGFIAQEVEVQFPELVTRWKHNQPRLVVEDALAVDYGHLVPVLVSAINELQSQIKQLQCERTTMTIHKTQGKL